MLLADTSAWVEYLRGTGSPTAARLRAAIAANDVLVIDPVYLEVMAGTRSPVIKGTRLLLEAQHFETLMSRQDWLAAAQIYRRLRQRGVTIRSHMDALIAAVAIRLEVEVLHRDRDFDVIEQHTALRTADV